jgi:hypothetical protein
VRCVSLKYFIHIHPIQFLNVKLQLMHVFVLRSSLLFKLCRLFTNKLLNLPPSYVNIGIIINILIL